MSIRPISLNADGSLNVLHDDAPGGAHTAVVPAGSITFAKGPGGTVDHRYLQLACPAAGCDSVATLPAGTGAAASQTQEMFVRLAARNGCPCGQIKAGAPLTLAQAHIKAQTEKMDGVGTWAAGTVR